MIVKFTKEYKRFAKNEIADFADGKAKRLVSKNVAEFAPKCFLLENLYVALVTYKDKFDNDTLGRKIFTLEQSDGKTSLTHVLSGAEFVLDSEKRNFVFEKFETENIKPMAKVFFDELVDENYCYSDYITVDRLEKFEKQLKTKQKDEEINFEL